MRWLYRIWPWLPPTRGEVLWTFFAVVVIGGTLVVYLWRPFVGRPLWYLNSGPGWTCEYLPKGEPVCVKDVPRRELPSAAPAP